MEEEAVQDRIENFLKEVPEGVKLVAISKTHSSERILDAYNAGLRDFGENKAQEMLGKQAELPDDIQWHFVGHLQRKKVKQIVPFVSLIHSVDSLRLLAEIEKRAANEGKVIDCLLQVHIAEEMAKHGLTYEQARTLLHPERTKEEFEHIRIRGLMGMATLTDDADKVRQEFRGLRLFFDRMKESHCQERPHFDTLSMGMTHDRRIAIEEGSTMIRVGTAIFGPRPQQKQA
ncbi:MAG: YggS family pyridoxal phosphate-dependent enzyme [Flavobacteriales bacterium]